MKLPEFFHEVPRIFVQDALAATLGCAENGVFEYSYTDAVKLTGHSCPTVASTYWLTFLALEHLYPGELPQRGGIKVEFRDNAHTGNIGVAAAIVQMLTGAAGRSGFKGLGGRFARAGLMRFSPDLLMTMRFTRMDRGDAVEVFSDLSLVPADERQQSLLERCKAGQAQSQELELLATLWQERVRRLLLDFARDPGVFVVRAVEPAPNRAAHRAARSIVPVAVL